MRTLLLALALGGMTMIAEADAQEKKEEKFPEKVTVRGWDANGKQFLNPQENVPAKRRKSNDGEKDIYDISPAYPRTVWKGTEITDADGVVWVAAESSGVGRDRYIVFVTKKADPKK